MKNFALPLAAAAAAGLALAPAALSAKPPKDEYAITLAAKPNPVVFSETTVLSGTLTGPAAGEVSVTLEEDTTIPLGDKFTPTGDRATTAADGTYSFSVQPDVNTQYRAVAKTSPDTQSEPRLVQVRPRVDLKVSDRTPAKGARVRFAGAVLPAHDGAVARIQRRRSGGWKTVGRATLADDGDAQSTFRKRVRVSRDGTYRVKVAKDADHAAGLSRRVKINVS